MRIIHNCRGSWNRSAPIRIIRNRRPTGGLDRSCHDRPSRVQRKPQIAGSSCNLILLRVEENVTHR
jgi:hypothetical protein